MSELPSVSVVVVNFNGRRHLADCFGSLSRVDYPSDRLEFICVDNASTDGSSVFMKRKFPNVVLVEPKKNLGFASGCNVGARRATGEYVAFINNDMRVDPQWVRKMLAPLDPGRGIVCTSGRILSWDGKKIDFAKGAANFHGMGYQVGFGSPAATVPSVRGELLFPCGGSMIVDRKLFLDLGGFDDEFFAYFEDVDFGWRLWLTGYRIAAASDAIVYHRFHGTADAVPDFRLIRFYERNALITLLKNVEEKNLPRLLAGALMLAARRMAIRVQVPDRVYEVGSKPPRSSKERLDRKGVATLLAVDDVIKDLGGILEKRASIQSKRVRSDDEIFRLFGMPFHPILHVKEYLETQASVVRLLALDELFEDRPASNVLVVADTDPSVDSIWGKKARLWAESLSGGFEVTLATRERIKDRPELRVVDWNEFASVDLLLQSHEVAFVHAGIFADRNPGVVDAVLIVDLEGVEESEQPWVISAIKSADLFTVPDEKARLYWEPLITKIKGDVEIVEVGLKGNIDRLHELCKYPERISGIRGWRRVRHLTQEVRDLIANREVEIMGGMLARDREIERLRNHFVLRTYIRVRKLIPVRTFRRKLDDS